MKYGLREICNVVLKAKATTKIGSRVFYKNEPVIYFDTLKTSSMEGGVTTVYAQGGRGNARLVAWDGERTVTWTMEDALISPEGLKILASAQLLDAANDEPIYQHMTETLDAAKHSTSTIAVSEGVYSGTLTITGLNAAPYIPINGKENFAYIMLVKDSEIVSEPIIPTHVANNSATQLVVDLSHVNYVDGTSTYTLEDDTKAILAAGDYDSFIVDYYVKRTSGAKQINITTDLESANFYLEADTLFRTQDGVDLPAEFVIPNCKVQSNFTFSMASTGDPSTFTFTMDSFPDYTRFDRGQKVMAAIQVISESAEADAYRLSTEHTEA